MAEKITVPALGESVSEATVSKWLKSQGEKVTADEPIVELETDKVNVEVPSPINGVLGSIAVSEGETVNVGTLLGTVDNSSSASNDKEKEVKDYNPPKKIKEDIKVKIFEEEKSLKPKKIKSKKIEQTLLKLDEEEPLILDKVHNEKVSQKIEKQVSPAARKMANESNISIDRIEGSGKNGLILKEDIMNLMGSKPAPSERKIKHGPEEKVKMTRLRLTIAKIKRSSGKCSNVNNFQ